MSSVLKKIPELLKISGRLHFVGLFLITFLILFLRWGYQYGSGDQVEILPYALKIQNPDLYINDLFINHLSDTPFNQRWAIGHLLSWFGEGIKIGTYVLFLVTLYFLILGLYRIARFFNLGIWSAFLFVLVALLFSQGWSPGGNDLYSPTFIPDSVAKPLLVWALYFFLNRLKTHSFLLIGFATLFQPLMGFQMFVLVGLSDLIGNRNILNSAKNTIAYMLAGGWLFGVLMISYFSGVSEVEMPQLFEIYFGFRAPHHFLPSYFMGAYSYVFFLVLGLALLYFYDRLPEIFWFLIVLLVGCIVYAVGVEVFHSTTIASTQWFKVTQWAKIFLLLFFFDKARPFLKSIENYILKPWIVLGGFVSLVVLIFLYWAPNYHPLHKPNDLVQKSSNSLMYEYVKNYTPVDACFVIPFQNSDFKHGARRSVYVDFKSVDPGADFMMLWKPRMDAVYGVPNLDSDKGFNFEVKANEFYKRLNYNNLLSLKNDGVTHLLTKWPITNSALKLAWNNDVYYIYEYQ